MIQGMQSVLTVSCVGGVAGDPGNSRRIWSASGRGLSTGRIVRFYLLFYWLFRLFGSNRAWIYCSEKFGHAERPGLTCFLDLPDETGQMV